MIEEGEQQALALARHVKENRDVLKIGRVYSSDLPRAAQTARPLAERLELPVTYLPAFREANNGKLAGMDNELAKARYPGVFWSSLGWEEPYPDGESPKEFYERIRGAWEELTRTLDGNGENAVLVTHGGVIQVILSLVNGLPFSNKEKQRSVPHAELITLTRKSGEWHVG